MRALSFITLLATLVLPPIVSAQVQTLTATHTYIMGDNDSRNDARQLCFLEAKRKVLEKAGVYIESVSEVKDFQLTKDKITSFAAAILRVEIVKENFAFDNGHNTLTLTVKSDVDVGEVQKQLSAIVADKSLQGRIAEQQQQIRQLEQQVQALNSRLSVVPVSSTGELRKERNVVFGNIEELENKKLAAIKAITEKTDIIRRYILARMTKKEVEGILGNPRARIHIQLGKAYGFDFGDSWNYGELWICFDPSDLVRGIGTDHQCNQ
ncbi:MAG: hypothetical protein GDA67_00715 [Nitrospira sp. CR1.3]|nr:hypothetical protein [Nitrospira sp. CR1.3]